MKITSQQGRIRIQIDVTAERVLRFWEEDCRIEQDETLGNYEVVEACDDDDDEPAIYQLTEVLPTDLMEIVRAAILRKAKAGKFNDDLQSSAEEAESIEVAG